MNLTNLATSQSPAISGENGSGRTFATACYLWRNSSDRQAVVSAMTHYNDTKCVPKWDNKRLERFINDAYKAVKAKNEIGRFAPKSDTQSTHISAITSTHSVENKATVNDLAGFSIVDTIAESVEILESVIACADILASGIPLAKRAITYLQSRGIGAKAINNFVLGLSQKKGMIVIPSFDLSLNVAYAMLRSFPHKQYQRVGAGHCLTGMYGRVGAETAVIVGGQLDAVLLWQHTPNDTAIVTLGSDNSSLDRAGYEWLQDRKRVIVAMDNDDSGMATANKWLATIPNAVIAPKFPTGKDAGELWQNLGDEGVKQWLGEARNG